MIVVTSNTTILFLYIIFHQGIAKSLKKEGNVINPFYR